MSTEIMGQGGNRSPFFSDLSNGLHQLALAISAGSRAAAEFKRLDRMNDAQLAREGLTRDEIGRAVFERHFA